MFREPREKRCENRNRSSSDLGESLSSFVGSFAIFLGCWMSSVCFSVRNFEFLHEKFRELLWDIVDKNLRASDKNSENLWGKFEEIEGYVTENCEQKSLKLMWEDQKASVRNLKSIYENLGACGKFTDRSFKSIVIFCEGFGLFQSFPYLLGKMLCMKKRNHRNKSRDPEEARKNSVQG